MESRYTPDEGCIAVIGMACRVPGADNIDEFWNNLLAGRTSMEAIPDEELAAGPHAELRHDPDYVSVRSSLRDYDLFDADFFGMSAREAGLMDPQHRLALEYGWRAFENAGYAPLDTEAVRTGVFGSSDMSSYFSFNLASHMMHGRIDVTEAVMGNDKDFLATRISYKNDFKGPAYTVQSACSSSLVSIHAASQALLAEECDRALVVSATVMLPGNAGYIYIPGGMRSPDGKCRPFDASANGTIFSNGVAAVLLKRYDEAARDGDHIWAVIRATAANNDGADKVGFSAPGVDGQTEVIRKALAVGGVDPADVAYVEGHGTGTHMGDPVEVAALLAGYGTPAPRGGGLIVLGSVKGNIGHMDATAGIGSFVKACLAMYHGKVPGTAHFASLNPEFGDISPFVVSADPISLQRREGVPLLAGVSAFGFGGTNAHVILQEAPKKSFREEHRQPHLLLLSAPGEEALKTQRALTGRYLADVKPPLGDVAYTLACGRKDFPVRCMVVAEEGEDAARMLLDSGVANMRVVRDFDQPIAFLFPGQGNLHVFAGYHFLCHDALFRQAFERIALTIREADGPDIMEVLRQCREDEVLGRELLARTDIAQPVLYGLEYALAWSLMERGLRPDCMVGHSLGEYSAAAVAGVFSPEGGARLVVRRGKLMQDAPSGRMLVVSVEASRLREVLGDAFSRVELSVINSPSNSVLSGDMQDLETCAALVENYGQRAIFLNTSHGFHSAAMDCVLEPFAKEFEGIVLSSPKIPFVSNLTGTWAGPEVASPDYWVRHMRNPVQFVNCLATLKKRVGIGVEVGPGNVMRSLVMQQGGGRSIQVIAGLDPVQAPGSRLDKTLRRSCLEVVGDVWMHGGKVNWDAFYAGDDVRRCPLPGVVLSPARHWIDPETEAMPDGQAAAGMQSAAKQKRTCSIEYAAPTTEVESKLVEIWCKLLFVESVGIHDDFLELGGNSIQVMQMIRSAASEGMRFTAKDVFESRNIAGLAERVAFAEPKVDLGPGPVPLPPYAAGWKPELRPGAQWLYSVFECPPDFGKEDVAALAAGLALKHDSLRMVWKGEGVELLSEKGRNWAVQNVEDVPAALDFAEYSDLLEAGSCRLLDSLSLVSGQSWRLTRFEVKQKDCASPQPRVLLAVSRMMADETSLGVIARDVVHFMTHGRLAQASSGSWKQWAILVSGDRFARESGRLVGQWKEMAATVAKALEKKTDAPGENTPEASCREERHAFPAHGLRVRLTGAAVQCRVSEEMLVTTAAAFAFLSCSGENRVLHCYTDGREPLFREVDPQLAVGSFSYRFPLIMPEFSPTFHDLLPWGKALFSSLPSHGKAAWIGNALELPIEAVFNGLGVTSMPETVAGKAAESIHLGVWEPANAPSEGTLEITALVSGGTLVIRLLGRPEALPVGWGEAFSKSFSETLFALVEDGLSDGSNCRYVPADFPDSELTDEDMTQILEQLQVAI